MTTKPKRKIVQIVLNKDNWLVVLCDDGSVWTEIGVGCWRREDTREVVGSP